MICPCFGRWSQMLDLPPTPVKLHIVFCPYLWMSTLKILKRKDNYILVLKSTGEKWLSILVGKRSHKKASSDPLPDSSLCRTGEFRATIGHSVARQMQLGVPAKERKHHSHTGRPFFSFSHFVSACSLSPAISANLKWGLSRKGHLGTTSRGHEDGGWDGRTRWSLNALLGYHSGPVHLLRLLVGSGREIMLFAVVGSRKIVEVSVLSSC